MALGNNGTDEQEGLLTLRNVHFLNELQGNQVLRGQQGCNKDKEVIRQEAEATKEFVNYKVEIPKGSLDRFERRGEAGNERRGEGKSNVAMMVQKRTYGKSLACEW